MSRLNDLVRQVGLSNETLAVDLQREVAALADRRSFGLNFERHVPEAVELPGRPVRRGDKVRILPPRGEALKRADEKLWQVTKIDRSGQAPVAELVALVDDTEATTAAVDDLVVVAEFRDPIYPGLVSTGKVERGGDKPFHTVINAENYHALQALLFTHRGEVDCIYIDPPYNTGAKDWKYNNDYVEGDDLYRHSKWLAFMERRLLLAKELLNPDDSVLIVTIDEREHLRLGLLLEQVFPDARLQMVTTVINQSGVARGREFYRADEYLFFAFLGDSKVVPTDDNMLVPREAYEGKRIDIWRRLLRSGTNSSRQDRPNMFYPFWVDEEGPRIDSVGEPIPLDADPSTVNPPRPGLVACWPVRSDNSLGRWQIGAPAARELLAVEMVKLGAYSKAKGRWSVSYLRVAERRRVEAGEIVVSGRDQQGALTFEQASDEMRSRQPVTVWNKRSHNAGAGGSNVLRALLPRRSFPFPKSLYAVEDALRFFLAEKSAAIVVDFFAGSGTTAHAVMRLNKQDGGRRTCIAVTNNEVSADEHKGLHKEGLRPGDSGWEEHGICDYITKPRIKAAITGRTPDGDPIRGDYKFIDEFPMADGFEENVEFLTLTYEAPLRVASHRDFERIAPLLWLRASSRGRRIGDVKKGWDVAEAYGVLADLDHVEPFLKAVAEQDGLELAFIVTDEDRLFESVARELPDHVEPVRLYAAYLRNFEIESGRGLR